MPLSVLAGIEGWTPADWASIAAALATAILAWLTYRSVRAMGEQSKFLKEQAEAGTHQLEVMKAQWEADHAVGLDVWAQEGPGHRSLSLDPGGPMTQPSMTIVVWNSGRHSVRIRGYSIAFSPAATPAVKTFNALIKAEETFGVDITEDIYALLFPQQPTRPPAPTFLTVRAHIVVELHYLSAGAAGRSGPFEFSIWCLPEQHRLRMARIEDLATNAQSKAKGMAQ